MKTTASYQRIQHYGENYYLLLRIYGLHKLNANQINQVTEFFDKILSGWPIDYSEIAVTVAPIYNNIKSYVIFIRTDDDTVFSTLYLGFNGSIFSDLTKILSAIVGRITNSEDAEYENKEYEEEANESEELLDENRDSDIAPADLIPESVDVDDILKDFERERREKEKEGEK